MRRILKQPIRILSLLLFNHHPRETLRILQDCLAECARMITMVLILKPAADYLPAKWARSLANRMSFIADITIMDDGQRARSAMKAAFSLSDKEAKKLARQWLATQFCDFVSMRRIARGREDPTKWKIIQRHEEVLKQIRESGTSFILATGQFSREAITPLVAGSIVRGKLASALQPRLPMRLRPRAMRLSIQVGQIHDACEFLRRKKSEWFVVGQTHVTGLMRHLLQPGNVAYVVIDAYWSGNERAYRRPFAGHKTFSFTTGPAALALVTRCPIVLCLPYFDGDGTVVLEWGPIIFPSATRDRQEEMRITDMLVDRIENAVGARPAQYVNAIGGGRIWNGASQRWESPEGKFRLRSLLAENQPERVEA